MIKLELYEMRKIETKSNIKYFLSIDGRVWRELSINKFNFVSFGSKKINISKYIKENGTWIFESDDYERLIIKNQNNFRVFREIKMQINNGGYNVFKVGEKWFRRGRLLLALFNPIENQNNMFCDHIDRNRLNDNLENLRWVSHSENMKNRDNSNMEKNLGKHLNKAIIINAFDSYDELIFTGTVKEALEKFGISNRARIHENLKKEYKTLYKGLYYFVRCND